MNPHRTQKQTFLDDVIIIIGVWWHKTKQKKKMCISISQQQYCLRCCNSSQTKCICSASVFLKHGRSMCMADVSSGADMADASMVRAFFIFLFNILFISSFVSLCPRKPATPVLPVNLKHREELLRA